MPEFDDMVSDFLETEETDEQRERRERIQATMNEVLGSLRGADTFAEDWNRKVEVGVSGVSLGLAVLGLIFHAISKRDKSFASTRNWAYAAGLLGGIGIAVSSFRENIIKELSV